MAAFAEVAVAVPVDTTFLYSVPSALAADVTVGRRVRVPFGTRRMTGLVVETRATRDRSFTGETKDLLEALDEGPLITEEELSLARWIAEYYRHPLGLVLKAVLPAGLDGDRIKPLTERVFALPTSLAFGEASAQRRRAPAQEKVLEAIRLEGELTSEQIRERFGARGAAAAAELVKKGLLVIRRDEVLRAPADASSSITAHEPVGPPPLTTAQAVALGELNGALEKKAFAPFLLEGVTGSGKTEVYLRAIGEALSRGRTALVLVPEIALTPQLTGRFRARFGSTIAVLHSGMSDGARFDEWRRIRRGDAPIAVGARSAVFAPLANLGIVIVDEEHDGSYKQDEGLRYHARDVAVMRAQRAGAVCVLGSATPSLESHHNATLGRYRRLVLPERVAARPMPPVERVQLTSMRKRGPLTPRLFAALAETLAAKKQAILFLNRRGYSPSLSCDDCGEIVQCRDCAVAMIFHSPALAKKKKAPSERSLFDAADAEEDVDFDAALPKGWLACHYCGRRRSPPSTCAKCGMESLRLLGVGTQRLEQELREKFPDARVARMDRDTTARRGSHEAILADLASGKIDILVGTQMIAKGLDFPGVTLVGVILADTSLALADFRAAERTFQLLTQVAGRAGRGETPGRVIVQSFHPDHYAIACAAAHDFAGFAERELEARKELFYPPFARLVNLRISGPDREAVEVAANALRARLDEAARVHGDAVRVVGPAPAPLSMLRGRHRWQVLVRAATPAIARNVAAAAVAASGMDGAAPARKGPRARTADVSVEIDVDPQSLL